MTGRYAVIVIVCVLHTVYNFVMGYIVSSASFKQGCVGRRVSVMLGPRENGICNPLRDLH